MSQRKRLLLVFVWACLCLVFLKSALFGSGPLGDGSTPAAGQPPLAPSAQVAHLRAREASSERPGEINDSLISSEHGQAADGATAPLRISIQQQKSSPHLNYRAAERAHEPIESVAISEQERQGRVDVTTSRRAISATASQAASHHHADQQDEAATQPRARRAESLAGSQCSYDYPNLYDLQFNNVYWQRLSVAGGPANSSTISAGRGDPTRANYYLYNAYYDDRWRAGTPSVRVLAMIDRVRPPPTNCLLWSASAVEGPAGKRVPRALVVRAQFVYAWYPKWGNYEDGLLQPWIVTCPVPQAHAGLVPDSVSLVGVPGELPSPRLRRASHTVAPSLSMPPSYSSSTSAAALAPSQEGSPAHQPSVSSEPRPTTSPDSDTTQPMRAIQYDCQSVRTVGNNLPVSNRRPPAGQKREKFAVCVKGLDFPHDDVSIRLVEWIELLHLLGAKKIFLYELDVHENIRKVLRYYQRRGLVELSPLTLPGDQPNLPELQHLYLKQKLTSKRQNELIPYNDCLYRNLYSFEYLALLDIDEIIMPLRSTQERGGGNWHELMAEVERMSLAEQNYSRASYNVRNVYFFDDLSGPLGTTQSVLSGAEPASSSSPSTGGAPDDSLDELEDSEADSEAEADDNELAGPGEARHESLERGVPHYLHMMSHVYRSKNYTEPGQYVKCFHNTERVVSLHNHFPMNCFGQCTTYSIPVDLAHLQHYRKDCVGPLRQSCKNDFRQFTTRDTTIWRYRQRMIKRTTRVLHKLGLLSDAKTTTSATSAAS